MRCFEFVVELVMKDNDIAVGGVMLGEEVVGSDTNFRAVTNVKVSWECATKERSDDDD